MQTHRSRLQRMRSQWASKRASAPFHTQWRMQSGCHGGVTAMICRRPLMRGQGKAEEIVCITRHLSASARVAAVHVRTRLCTPCTRFVGPTSCTQRCHDSTGSTGRTCERLRGLCAASARVPEHLRSQQAACCHAAARETEGPLCVQPLSCEIAVARSKEFRRAAWEWLTGSVAAQATTLPCWKCVGGTAVQHGMRARRICCLVVQLEVGRRHAA
jgi:hypothetical protein